MTERSKLKSVTLTGLVLAGSIVLGGGSYHFQKWLDTPPLEQVNNETGTEGDEGVIDDGQSLSSTDQVENTEMLLPNPEDIFLTPEMQFLNSFVGLWQDVDGKLAFVVDLENQTVWLRHQVDKSQELGYSSTQTVCFRAFVGDDASLMNEDRILLQSDISVYSQTFGETLTDGNSAASLIVGNATKGSDEFRLMLSINDSDFTDYGYLRDLTEEEASVVISECLELFG